MEPETVLNLFDSNWFYLTIFETQSQTSASQNQENSSKNPNISRNSTLHKRSKSDQIIINPNTIFNTDINISSPNSVLRSEKEISIEILETPKLFKKKKEKRQFSKSLSDLEFEELKGFMDLGFVFSEEDKEDSSLVEIIPGLHKLGLNEFNGPRERPYLSEAWESPLLPLMNWRVLSKVSSNEVYMKDSLKLWAHTVASAVR